MKRACIRCGADYLTEDKRRKFCGVKCYHAHQREHPNAGTFHAGIVPWNRELRGIHLSPGSEFKPGQPAPNHVPVGTVRVRRFTRGDTRAFVKVAEPNHWRLRAVVAWERANGRALPRGMLVHHIDRDTLNDDPGNLVALTRAEHLAEHRAEYVASKRAKHIARRRIESAREQVELFAARAPKPKQTGFDLGSAP